MLDMGKPPNSTATKPDSESDEDIGHIHPLRAYRKEHFVSLDALSFLTGISMASLSRIERYKQFPLISAAKKIIKATGNHLKPEDFFGKKI
jgi:DNA-binding XRE family transcriptional regulator